MRVVFFCFVVTALLSTGAASAANECSSDLECPGNDWFCLSGQCVAQHVGGECVSDVQCAIDDHCVDGVCVR